MVDIPCLKLEKEKTILCILDSNNKLTEILDIHTLPVMLNTKENFESHFKWPGNDHERLKIKIC